LLVVAGLLFVAAAGLPARILLGENGPVAVVHCGTAVLLCLVPGALTLLWAGWSIQHDPQQAGIIALGASGVRMFGVLAVAALLFTQVPLYRDPAFLFWVLGAYLYLLAIEVWLLVRDRHSDRPEKGNTPAS